MRSQALTLLYLAGRCREASPHLTGLQGETCRYHTHTLKNQNKALRNKIGQKSEAGSALSGNGLLFENVATRR